MARAPLRFAHRGMPRLARENTLPSFSLALECGADGIELDVHATADAKVVVHHDPVLESGAAIAAKPLMILREQEDAAGHSLPTLQEVGELVRGQAELLVEVKGTGIERAVLGALRGYRGPYAIHSFDHALIARLHVLDPSLRLGLLFEEPVADVAALLRACGARDVWPHSSLVTSELVADVHAAGARVIPWTVNTSSETARLVALGVDALCGDDVRIFPGR